MNLLSHTYTRSHLATFGMPSTYSIRLLSVAIAAAFAMSTSFNGYGETVTRDSVEVFFRQGKSVLDPTYRHDGERIDSLFHELANRQEARPVKVDVIGSASPEGPYLLNRRLSERRARSIFDYVTRNYNLPDSITEFKFMGRDWRGLRRLVELDDAVPSREKVLSALDKSIASGESTGETGSNRLLSRLKGMDGGRAYSYMYTHLFPQLRYSRLAVEYVDETPLHPQPVVEDTFPTPVVADTPGQEGPEAILISESDLTWIPLERKRKPFYMDIRTNMLLDASLIPNIGAEFYLGKDFSIYADWMHAWWSKDSSHRYWRMYGGEVGGRWWFGKAAHAKPLTGHHLGIYAGAFTFDFELGGKGYMGGKPHGTIFDRCFVHAGVDYGYSLPVAKRLNIDFTIGVGYMTGKYITYEPGARPHVYYWESTKRFRWVGPTKAEISLVWLIGRGNWNE